MTAAGPASGHTSFLRWVAGALLVAAGAEFLLLRLFTRVAIHIPGLDAVAPLYTVLSALGRYAFFVGVTLLVLGLGAVVRELARRRPQLGEAPLAAVVAFASAAVAARLGLLGDLGLALVVLVAVATLFFHAARGLTSSGRLTVAAFAAAFALAGTHAVLQHLARSGFAAEGMSPWLLYGAEVLAVGAALASPLLVGSRRLDRRALAWAGGAGVVTLAALVGNGATVKILMLWSAGLAGYLPDAVYALAAGAFVFTLISLVREDRMHLAVCGVLVVLGGIGLHSTYQSALVVTGFALLLLEAVDDTSPRDPVKATRPRARAFAIAR